MKNTKCPFFIRKTHSYRFSGLKCSMHLNGFRSMGDNLTGHEWRKDQRDKKLEEHCHGNYAECNLYQAGIKKNRGE